MGDTTAKNREPKRLAIKLSAAGERSIHTEHPWIFSDSIEKVSKDGNAGDLAIIFSKRANSVIGVGLYDPSSPIAIKMLHHGSGATIDAAFFRKKIQRAFALRMPLLKTKTNSYRLLFGENDGFPGLIVDVYNDTAVIKVYSEIWEPYLPLIVPAISTVAGTETVVLRLSRKLLQSKNHKLGDGQVLLGTLDSEEVEFLEHGIRFTANVIKGHKTGYFLDHRHNRKKVGALAKGKTVLDVFCYAGGFSVHALVGGAKQVTSIDISEQALEVAKANGALNSFTGTHQVVANDAFAELADMAKENRTFNLVVLDPPSLASKKDQTAIAKKKYEQLAQLGAKVTGKNGYLVVASCSSRVPATDFFEIVKKVLDASGRKYKLLEQTYHDTDHPVTFPEGSYLKCGYYQFKD